MNGVLNGLPSRVKVKFLIPLYCIIYKEYDLLCAEDIYCWIYDEDIYCWKSNCSSKSKAIQLSAEYTEFIEDSDLNRGRLAEARDRALAMFRKRADKKVDGDVLVNE